MNTRQQATKGRAKILVGIACFVLLIYWICALNTAIPGSQTLAALYEWSYLSNRRGPLLFWVLVFAGLGLIGWGMRDLGLIEED